MNLSKVVGGELDFAFEHAQFRSGMPLRTMTVARLADELANHLKLEVETVLPHVKEWCDENDVYIYGTTERRPE